VCLVGKMLTRRFAVAHLLFNYILHYQYMVLLSLERSSENLLNYSGLCLSTKKSLFFVVICTIPNYFFQGSFCVSNFIFPKDVNGISFEKSVSLATKVFFIILYEK